MTTTKRNFPATNKDECEALTAYCTDVTNHNVPKLKPGQLSNSAESEVIRIVENNDSKDFENIGDHNNIMNKNLRNRAINRIIAKNGHINLTKFNIGGRKWNFTLDVFTTLVEVSWFWTLFTFCVAYVGSWFLFAVGWYLILFIHNDLDPINIENANETWKPCITGIGDFTSAFLFSLETQHTTGYGFYQVTEECIQAIILLGAQSIVGVIFEGIFVGMVLIKISRAKKRRATLMFSRNALISERDGKMYFMFRVADQRKNPLVEPKIRAQFIQKRKTEQGELVRASQQEFYVHGEGETSNRLFLFWPTTVLHEIDATSPFYRILKEDLRTENSKFEVIITLEGSVESTGNPTQARTSYLPDEILWGHYFYDLGEGSSKEKDSGERVIDYSLFHETYNPHVF